ncbi:MAG: alpha/beta hydrolase fold protein [Propionibacteriaceae bacterium]|jgi:pimeloyl-ACP methyl ester carboxylesterase|nr:alpha/beta hydrolase fold protein [Propionibacteriaceae bacterium]
MTSTATPPAPDRPSILLRLRQELSSAPVVTGPAHPGSKNQNRPPSDDSGPRGHIGWIVVGSMATGLVAAVLLVAAPFIPLAERAVTGAVLCGFALGWAVLALLSVRLTDQPQRWAAAPALFMGLGGLLLLAFGSPVHEVLDWAWPPALLVLVVWMIVQVRRRLGSRSGRWLLYPVIAMLAVASIGGGYQTVREAADAKASPMPGQLIDVGGHRLHLSCTGSGSPTVVLEPGAGMVSTDLGRIAPAVARNTRVCVYDRAGRGWSEPADTPQDATQIATDLHTLLHRGHVPGPYVLAGHSFGGLYTLTFAARYPDEVAGMVLVDSTAPASAVKPRATPPGDGSSYDLTGRVSALISTSARFGLGRLVGQPTASALRSTIDEYIQGNSSVQQAASLRDFADKPLIVLTAGVGSDAGWSAKQDALATLSTNSAHRVIEGATHASLISDEEDAVATTHAIHDVVASLRGTGPLGK